MARISHAVLSVSDKRGIANLATGLVRLGVQILSTGGTANVLREAGVPVRDVSDYTGFPEMMDGRLKTLHQRVHGGILGRAGEDDAVMAEHGMVPIGLVVVNLYPFAQTVARPGCTFAEAVENIDIGGPAMIRSAGKNLDRVSVVVDPDDYPEVLREISSGGGLGIGVRTALAQKAFAHTAAYDTAISDYYLRYCASAYLDE